jgi:alpha-galactosidase
MKCERTILVAAFEFVFSCEVDDTAAVEIILQVDEIDRSANSYLVRAVVREPSGADFLLNNLSISWSVPLVDVHGLYFGGNPGEELSRLPFWRINKQTCANTGVPYIALIHRTGENRAAFGPLDQLTETHLSAELSEATRCYHFRVEKPASKTGPSTSIRVSGQWEERFFVSKERQPWPEVLKKYVQVTDQFNPQSLMHVPQHAYDPVFCSWTAIHHDVSHDWIMRNAAIAADLGFKTWITDDGWFISTGRFADYSFTGDWEPYAPKFPDFQAHVRAVQNLGFRYVLWLSPFMVGRQSQAAKRYAHLLTTGSDRLNFDNLAPWHDETQEVIAALIERLVNDYHLDGLKVDFIDAVSIESIGANGRNGVGATSIGQSIFSTLKGAIDRALALKPDILIEFRNSYTNLASRSYANLYRSSDVPINFGLNRWQAVMLRLLTPDRAVHLDPALWHQNDSDENVAVHLINCLVSVPMVSIELDKYPQTHLDLIRYWIGFYNQHRDTIVHGEFRPILRLGHVPMIQFVGNSELIVGLYEDIPVSLERQKHTWILNASTRPYIELTADEPHGECEITLRDKFGCVIGQEKMHFPVGQIEIEVGGSVEIG